MNTHEGRSELGQNCKLHAQAVGALGSLGISKQRALKMLDRFDIGSSVRRLLARRAPTKSGFFEQLGGVTMLGEQLWLAFSNVGELVFKGLNDAAMQRASWLAQQSPICSILDKGMLKQIGRMRRHALPKQ
jgi:hypothetical protein